MLKNTRKLKIKQIFILINIFILFLITFIYLLDNKEKYNYLIDKEKYLNPLFINKSLNYQMKVGNKEKFDKWLENKKTNINIINKNGNNLLMTAIANNYNLYYIKKLVKKTNKDYISKDNITPLKISIYFDRFEVFKILLENKFVYEKEKLLKFIENQKQLKNKNKYLIILKSI